MFEIKFIKQIITEIGRIGASYSNDGGESFNESFCLTFSNNVNKRQELRNPRGSLTPKRLNDGHVLLIYYNNVNTQRFGSCSRRYYWYTI